MREAVLITVRAIVVERDENGETVADYIVQENLYGHPDLLRFARTFPDKLAAATLAAEPGAGEPSTNRQEGAHP